jgi:hypothetical protein
MTRQPNPHNLNPTALGSLDLDPAKPGEYLLHLRGFVESRAMEAIDWYLARKMPIARWSKALRLCAILLATLGAVLPLIGSTPLLGSGQGATIGTYGYVFLALSGAAVLLDKLFGFSSRWMRYMSTAMALQRRLAEFELDWAAVWLGVVDQTPSDAQKARLMELLRTFRLVIADELARETQTWVAEFENGMAQLERQARLEQQVKGEAGGGKSP